MSEIGRRLVRVEGKRFELETFEVPEPGPGQVLVRVNRSQVSAGTERSGLLQEAGSPEFRRLMGYITVGRVLAAGPGMEEYRPDDRVLAFGSHGSHWLTGRPPDPPPRWPSEITVSIQRIEQDITDEQAAFAVLGDFAMQGIRRAELQIDESVAVFGQGVVGQLVTAFCRLSGAYPVIAIDMDADRLALSKRSGATHTVDASKEDSIEAVRSLTNGGAECTSHATRSAQTLVDCMKAAADRGMVAVIGFPPDTVELELRGELLRKELQIRGVHGVRGLEDKPHPYWPWSLQRNRRGIMRMIATGDLQVDHLISHVAKPEEADDLYQKIMAGPKGWMAIFFDWEDEPS